MRRWYWKGGVRSWEDGTERLLFKLLLSRLLSRFRKG